MENTVMVIRNRISEFYAFCCYTEFQANQQSKQQQQQQQRKKKTKQQSRAVIHLLYMAIVGNPIDPSESSYHYYFWPQNLQSYFSKIYPNAGDSTGVHVWPEIWPTQKKKKDFQYNIA